MVEFTIDRADANQKINNYLRKTLTGFSKGDIDKLLRKKRIRVNGNKISHNIEIVSGDKIILYIDNKYLRTNNNTVKKVDFNNFFSVIAENDDILVISKNTMVLAQPGDNTKPSLIDALDTYFKPSNNPSSTFKPAPANRLDYYTSGITLVPKTVKTAQDIANALKTHIITKYYIAIMKRELSSPVCYISDMTPGNSNCMLSKNGQILPNLPQEFSKEAVTKFIPVLTNNQFTLCLVKIPTGKKHQIRVHAAQIGNPLPGDRKYNPDKDDFQHYYLHSYMTIINDTVFTAELPENFIDKISEIFSISPQKIYDKITFLIDHDN